LLLSFELRLIPSQFRVLFLRCVISGRSALNFLDILLDLFEVSGLSVVVVPADLLPDLLEGLGLVLGGLGLVVAHEELPHDHNLQPFIVPILVLIFQGLQLILQLLV
jgi:hypothetical protein